MTKDEAKELLARTKAVIRAYARFRRATPMDDDFRDLLEDVDGLMALLNAYQKGLKP